MHFYVLVYKASLLEDMSHVHSLVQLGSGLFNPLDFFFRQVRNVLDVLDFLDAFSFRSSAVSDMHKPILKQRTMLNGDRTHVTTTTRFESSHLVKTCPERTGFPLVFSNRSRICSRTGSRGPFWTRTIGVSPP